ncbi:MAG TPA: DUF1559 domain-containing protein, partial [Planctomycetia bacterium]|nr:DUF1559 domain-containing protein [Planctomycetia bacterium]
MKKFRLFRLARWVMIAAVAAATSYFVLSSARQGSLRESNSRNLGQLAAALQQYHERYKTFPPAYLTAQDGTPMHSWRILVIPFLDGGADIYARYNFAQPWNGPDNRALSNSMPSAFGDPFNPQPGMTRYCAIVGSRTMWPGHLAVRINDIRDGSAMTYMLTEGPQAIDWLRPKDVSMAEFAGYGAKPPLAREIGRSRRTFAVARADGNVDELDTGV